MEAVENASTKIPVVLMQSFIDVKGDINRVMCDEYQLGKSLVEDALNNISKSQNIMIITSNNSTSYSERYNGVLDVLNESNHKYVISNIENYVDYTFFNKVLDSSNIGAIVCMDRDITEKIAELKKISINENYNKDVLILGVGNTNKIISLLEEEVVNATAVQNEFNIGYIAVKNAIQLKNGKKVEESKAIKSTVISSKDMYSPKNERILFQFVR